MLIAQAHRRGVTLTLAFVTILIFVHLRLDFRSVLDNVSPVPQSKDEIIEPLHCSKLPLANDTLVVMKTGSTELQNKLPIHFDTTLRCYPNYAIYSDAAEELHGHQILDSLEDVDPEIKASHDDFALYRQLQQKPERALLQQSEFSEPDSKLSGANGKTENPGWKLDKWKFLPLMRKTIRDHPEKHWYVFVETDTFLFWETLLAYLAELDSTKSYYIGAQTWIGDVEFAHGGSGYLVSRPALERVVKQYEDNQHDWEKFTDKHWAGDCVLGKAFKDAGIPLTPAWPIFQGDAIGNMNYGHSQRLWCQPTVSYHHVDASAIEHLWRYGRSWASRQTASQPFLRHRDVFAGYILPQTTGVRSDWDNHANDDKGIVESPEKCMQLCEKDSTCLQWGFDSSAQGRCLTTSRPNMGKPAKSKTSGWINGRMQAFYDAEKTCEGDGWVL